MKVFAGELRAMGAEIPAEIPDCATIDSGDIQMGVGKVTGNPGDKTLPVTCTFRFRKPFEWVEATIRIEGE